MSGDSSAGPMKSPSSTARVPWIKVNTKKKSPLMGQARWNVSAVVCTMPSAVTLWRR